MGKCEVSEDKYEVDNAYCNIGTMEDSEFPIKKSGKFGEHVCITIREKKIEKLSPRYEGKFDEDCQTFSNYKFMSI